MEGLLTNEIKKSLEEIVTYCFYGNRMVDRICSLISVKFVMPRTEKILHQNYAHLLPALADDISGYMDARDCTTVYGATPIGDQEYDNYIECFKMCLDINLELEKKVINSIKVARNTGDITTKVFLETFLNKLIPLTKDLLTLVDKAEMYGDTTAGAMKFDHDVESFGVFA